MRKIELGKKNITINLVWSTLNTLDSSSGKAIKAFLQENNDVKKGIIIKGEEEFMIAAIPADEKMTAPSGAAWLTAANKKHNARQLKENGDFEHLNWIVVQTVDPNDDKFWVVVVEKGAPTADSDVVCSRRELLNIVKDISDGPDAGSFILYTDDEEVYQDFNQTGTIIVEKKTFEELVKGVPVRYKPRQLTGLDPKVLYAVFGIIVIGVAGYLYNDWATEKALMEQQTRNSQQQQQTEQQKLKAQAEYEAQKKVVVEQAIADAKSGLNDLISKGVSKSTITSWADIIDTVPMAHDGWKLVGVECALSDNVPSCNVNLDRGELGINRTLMQDFPDVNINGDKANYILTGSSITFPKRNFEALPSVRYFKMETQSKMQEIKFGDVKHAFDASNEITKDITLPQPPVGVTQDTNIEPIRLGVSTGPVHVEGTGLWQLRGLAEVMNDATLNVKTLSVTFGGDDMKMSSWKLEGDYYVKVADQITIPTIPPSKTVVGG